MQDKPAYPVPGQYPGLSIRDWFAGMALQGLIAEGETENLALKSYAIADEMLKQQEKQG